MLRRPAVVVGRRITRYRREVIQGYPGLRLGNILYLALQAHRSPDGSVKVACTPADGTLELFPTLRELLLENGGNRLLDSRIHLPELFFQQYGIDFSADELQDFIARRLLPTRPSGFSQEEQRVVINVRRGDYYSNPAFRAAYGFDIPSYLRAAVSTAAQQERVDAICVVSDDITWCRDNLQFLRDEAPRLEFLGNQHGLAASFWTVATGRRLILANSTFSYWAAYISGALYGSNAVVLAPEMHARGNNDGRAWQHAPTWQAIPVAPAPPPDDAA